MLAVIVSRCEEIEGVDVYYVDGKTSKHSQHQLAHTQGPSPLSRDRPPNPGPWEPKHL
jgi:hypothetical protein